MPGLKRMIVSASIFSLVGFACATGRYAPKPQSSGRQGLIDRLKPKDKDITLGKSNTGEKKDSAFIRWPLQSVQLTSKFGKRGRRFHEGVDLRAKTGTPVYAAKSGTVIYADKKIRGYGQMVVIRHQADLATVYAHHSKILVKKGEQVNQGQLIALSGSSGRSRGAHLHFEVRRGVSALDPLKLLEVPTGKQLAKLPPARLVSIN